MEKLSPILRWLDRGTELKALLSPKSDASPNLELGGFVALDVAVPLHKASELCAESLEGSWELAHRYIEDCKAIIEIDEPMWLDKFEISQIKNELGEPPPLAYPIYFMSVADENGEEKLAYVGRTSSKNSRFSGGHAAITKLHAPEYQGLDKWLYLGCIVLLTEDNYLPLEWVNPLGRAQELLHSIEAQLIYYLQPELNINHKKHNNTKEYVQLHIQNFSSDTQFLNDQFV
jgi:hypothetical protein